MKPLVATTVVLLLSPGLAGCGEAPGKDGTGTEPQAPAPAPEPEPAPLTLAPELAEMFRLIGQGRLDAARAGLREWVDAHPADGRGRFLLGLTYHREKRYALARPHFEAAGKLEPNYHPIWHFLGWCLYYLGDVEASRAAFERHLALDPDEGDSHFALGLIALDADRLDEAEQRLRRAIELQGDNPRRRRDVAKCHARLGDVLVRRGDLEAARAELETATAMWPEHYAAFYKLSRVLTRLGDEAGAARALQRYRHYQRIAEARRGVPEEMP